MPIGAAPHPLLRVAAALPARGRPQDGWRCGHCADAERKELGAPLGLEPHCLSFSVLWRPALPCGCVTPPAPQAVQTSSRRGLLLPACHLSLLPCAGPGQAARRGCSSPHSRAVQTSSRWGLLLPARLLSSLPCAGPSGCSCSSSRSPGCADFLTPGSAPARLPSLPAPLCRPSWVQLLFLQPWPPVPSGWEDHLPLLPAASCQNPHFKVKDPCVLDIVSH